MSYRLIVEGILGSLVLVARGIVTSREKLNEHVLPREESAIVPTLSPPPDYLSRVDILDRETRRLSTTTR